ncbi:MAG TPA: AgmX/PglI C-terminal domain-containing protein [Sandaracinaceae bacterium LLY-WYZ-13_1]|nr:AgmX/PglI C-terminal domain-containing protein [Sandaracinaceae bacterium LLY-WYZ-13_1]
MKRTWIGVCLVVLGAAGCGGGDETSERAEPAATTAGDERPRERDDGAQITGLMGTIPRDEVEGTLNPKMNDFMQCLAGRMGDVEFLAGDIRLSFRIHTDGSVAWVYPEESDFGDREAERCILEVARRTRFPRPRGGEAEFSWGFGFDAPDDVRPPLSWAADALGERSEDVSEVARSCDAHGDFVVTAYVEPGGAVLAAGGSTPDSESEATLDCILEAVRAWEMPDPGSYPAKITFPVR